MHTVKLTRYYIITEFTPKKTRKILGLIKDIDIDTPEGLSDAIKKVEKVVKIAVGRRFKCTNTELVSAFLKIVSLLPYEQFAAVVEVSNAIEKVRQK